MEKLNTSHWEKFYKKFSHNKPSNFAKYIIKKKYLKKNSKTLEIGSGNGRDTFYFLKNKIDCLSIDKSKIATSINSKKIKNIFFCLDITKLSKNRFYFFKKKKIENIYARFLLHTLNPKEEIKFFYFCEKLLIKKGLLFMEFRTTQDPLIKKGKVLGKNERLTDHYRRFIEVKDLIKILKKKFKIIYYKKSFGLAKFKKDDPNICRLILRRK